MSLACRVEWNLQRCQVFREQCSSILVHLNVHKITGSWADHFSSRCRKCGKWGGMLSDCFWGHFWVCTSELVVMKGYWKLAVARNCTQDAWLELPVLCCWAATTSPYSPSYVCTAQVVLYVSVVKPGSCLASAIRTLLGVNQKIFSKELLLSGFLIWNV